MLSLERLEALEEWHGAVQTATSQACDAAAQGVQGLKLPEAVEYLRIRCMSFLFGDLFMILCDYTYNATT